MQVLAQSKAEIEVSTAVETLRKAMEDGNESVLQKLTDEKLTYGHSNGRIEDKASFVQSLASKQSDFVDISLSEQTVIINGNTALVRHKMNGNTNDAGKGPGTLNLGVLQVWIKNKGGWKLAARQAFKL
jgi:hypothetical protein